MTEETYTIIIDDDSNIISIIRDSDNASIPQAEGNRDYQEFLEVQRDYPENAIFETGYEYTTDGKWSVIRSKRDHLLKECDWTQLPDSPKYQDESWLVYRQALRNITEQSDPFNIVWPVRPEE